MRVLVSAYACNPMSSQQLHPGEDLVGWQMVRQIGRRHEVSVITHTYNRPGVEAGLAGEPMPGVRFHFLSLPRWMWALYRVGFGERIYYYLWQISAWRLARRLHREAGFDLAHHLTFGNDWIASYIGAFLPVPFVWGPVGGGHTTPGPLWKEYTLYGRFAEGARSVAQWFGRRDPVRRRMVRRAKALAVCNRETKAKLPRAYDPKIHFFPVNGIGPEDLVRPEEIEPRPAARPFRVFMAGRFHRLKGFSLAVRAFASFAAKAPGARFLIVGSGPEESRIRKVIRDLDLDGKVEIRGWMPRRDVVREMKASDVFLFPSFRDGGGAVIVEAMASGKPVICLDTAGPGFHIEPEWGIKLVPREPALLARDMAGALERLYRDEEERLRIGKAARRRAEEYYLWDRLGDRMAAIYEAAIGAES